MQNARVPILGFAAYSGTGKTTLLTRLIPLLKKSGLKPGVIKHSHHNFEIDQPGKDSFRLRTAGATPVMLVSTHRRAIITEFENMTEPKLDDQLKVFDQSSINLILVEGFKTENFPKIELHRPSLKKPLIFPNDSSIFAVATDQPIKTPAHLDQLDINNPHKITDYIIQKLLQKSL